MEYSHISQGLSSVLGHTSIVLLYLLVYLTHVAAQPGTVGEAFEADGAEEFLAGRHRCDVDPRLPAQQPRLGGQVVVDRGLNTAVVGHHVDLVLDHSGVALLGHAEPPVALQAGRPFRLHVRQVYKVLLHKYWFSVVRKLMKTSTGLYRSCAALASRYF